MTLNELAGLARRYLSVPRPRGRTLKEDERIAAELPNGITVGVLLRDILASLLRIEAMLGKGQEPIPLPRGEASGRGEGKDMGAAPGTAQSATEEPAP